MTITRRNRMIVFECDVCGKEHPSFTDDFHDALADFKEDGVVRLVNGDFEHYCSECEP